MANDEAKTMINKSKSKILDKVLSGANMNIAERYCAKTMIGML
jgi:hypothetical protein